MKKNIKLSMVEDGSCNNPHCKCPDCKCGDNCKCAPGEPCPCGCDCHK
ncbi:MAG: hypothetical protein FWE74_04185 [Oscillospiraceae bacterium]|nr:hypothetical protein [Oscillospiraceae bacterium]